MGDIVTTQDIFLKGRLTIEQPRAGFRSGSDAVLLAAACAGFPFKYAIEAGCGAGAALLSLHVLRANQIGRLAGLEKDDLMVALAEKNVLANGCDDTVEICRGDILNLEPNLLSKFDLVFSNPPFFDNNGAIRAPAPQRQSAYILGAPLEAWIKGMLDLAAPKGRIIMIHRADRLPDILDALKGKAGDIGVYPIRSRTGENAKRVIVSAQKGSRAPMRLLAGMDMHPSTSAFTGASTGASTEASTGACKGDGRFSAAYEAVCEGGVLFV